ncbi:Odorant-binding protein 69a [Carabus blaptoides fortunei]
MAAHTFVILFLLTALTNVLGRVTYSDEIENFLLEMRAKCKAESGASDESILSSLNGGKMAEDEAYKCYLWCTLYSLGKMTEDNKEVDVEGSVAKLPQDLVDAGVPKIIRACGTQKGATDCETGFLTLQCYQQADPDIFITI